MVTPIDVLKGFDCVAHAASAIINGKRHHTLGFRIWEGAQKDGVHDAENRGVRADAQRQRENRNETEARALRQHSNAEAKILPKRLQERFPAGRTDILFHGFEAPHCDPQAEAASSSSAWCGLCAAITFSASSPGTKS